MTLPKLAVPNSGWGGRGYKNPVTEEKTIVPSVTTVLKAESKEALVQWAVNQTAGYAVANAHELLTHSEDWGYKNLRFYYKRNPKDLIPGMNLHDYWNGVRDDAADQGTWIHEWIQADVVPELEYPDVNVAHESYWDMVEQWDIFKAGKEIIPHFTEATVWNGEAGYAGTLDGVWEIDGVHYLLDIKSSRGLYSSTWMQLAALRAAPEMFVPQPDDTYASLRGWQKPVQDVAVLHIRPRDTDHRGNAMSAFCKLVQPPGNLDTYYRGFQGLLDYGKAMRDLRVAEKEAAKNGK